MREHNATLQDIYYVEKIRHQNAQTPIAAPPNLVGCSAKALTGSTDEAADEASGCTSRPRSIKRPLFEVRHETPGEPTERSPHDGTRGAQHARIAHQQPGRRGLRLCKLVSIKCSGLSLHIRQCEASPSKCTTLCAWAGGCSRRYQNTWVSTTTRVGRAAAL
jgi:hypothetical protein